MRDETGKRRIIDRHSVLRGNPARAVGRGNGSPALRNPSRIASVLLSRFSWGAIGIACLDCLCPILEGGCCECAGS